MVEDEPDPTRRASIPVNREPHLALELKLLAQNADEIGTALGEVDMAPDDPPALQSFRKFWCGGWRDSQSTAEKIDFAACFEQVRDAHSLGQLPVRILSAGTAINSPFLPVQARPALQSKWNDLQSQFLHLSSNSNQSFALNSGHFVQRDAPELITATLRDLVRSPL